MVECGINSIGMPLKFTDNQSKLRLRQCLSYSLFLSRNLLLSLLITMNQVSMDCLFYPAGGKNSNKDRIK